LNAFIQNPRHLEETFRIFVEDKNPDMNVFSQKLSTLKETFRIFVEEKGPSYECLELKTESFEGNV
jgi:hypothetical protein